MSVLIGPPRGFTRALGFAILAVVLGSRASHAAADSTATPAVRETLQVRGAEVPEVVDAVVGRRDAWSPDQHWLDLRIGYAKSAERGAPDGNIGAGFGFTYIGKGMWSIGAHTHVELLGRFGGAALLEVPMTFEVERHFAWKTVARPYLGAGGGAFFHKTYRTGADEAHVRPGYMLVGGFNAAISEASLLGFDIRMVFQGSASSRNPVFPNDTEDAVQWSVKLNYARIL